MVGDEVRGGYCERGSIQPRTTVMVMDWCSAKHGPPISLLSAAAPFNSFHHTLRMRSPGHSELGLHCAQRAGAS